MPKAFPREPAGGTGGAEAAGTPDDGEHRELGRLLHEAIRLLEATDLSGANETLKEAEKALAVREDTNV